MKKTIILWLFNVIVLTITSQTTYSFQPITTNGIYDTVFDQLGNRYALNNLRLDSPMDITGQNARPAPTLSCSAGYFNLYFAVGSCFDGSSLSASNKRIAICQLFSDISNFINSPLSAPSNTVRINVYCDNTSGPSTSALGSASPIFAIAPNTTNPNQGIADCQIYKAIITGVDPWSNLPISIFPTSAAFYSCFVNANATAPWNDDITIGSIGSGQYDFYSVMLHEVTHSLGFLSLINNTGLSKFGAANNYYSRFDKFLTNAAGNPLLLGSNPCTQSNLQFQGPTSQITVGGSTTSINQNLTNCATAARYIGSVNVALYTPFFFEPPSSLSHFEDICSTPPGFTSTCTSTPPNNDLYFVMSNSNGPGNCFFKRYLTEEERLVLCDLGYSVKNVYNSAAVSATHTYSYGACPGTNIWGINDGISANGNFIFTSTTNVKSIPKSTITGNDSPTTNSISCIEVLYNNATAALSGANLVVTAPAIGTGLVIIKYLPKNTVTGKYGNATYIYVYFLPGNCNPPNACNMIQNGGFENLASGNCGGEMVNPSISPQSSLPKLSCWGYYEQNSPDLYTTGCTTHTTYNLGINTINTAPVVHSFNGVGNKRVIGLSVWPSQIGGYGPYEEDMKNNLSTPLIPNQAYQVSFWAYSYSGYINNLNPNTQTSINPNKFPLVITCASALNFASAGSNFPTGLNVLTDFTVNVNTVPTSTLWTQYTHTFVFAGTSTENAFIIGLNPIKTAALGIGNDRGYVFIDEVSLIPLPTPTFVIPNNVICATDSYTNLSQYADPVGGTFSGPGVTLNGGYYNFNSPPTLPPGSYPIAMTYTSGGCVHTLYQQVFVGGVSAGTSSVFCSYNNYTLTAVGYPATTSYTWLPSGQISPTLVANGNNNITYTLVTNSTGCNQAVFTPTIIPSTIINSLPGPWCGNNPNPLGIAIPNYTVPTAITQIWSVNNYTVPVIFVSYTGIINPVYTATTSANGCTNIATYTATWTPPFTVSISNTSQSNCLVPGQSATLSAFSNPSGASFTWQPSGIGNSIVVSPTATTIYTAVATSGACTNIATTTVNVVPPITFTNLPVNWCTYQNVFYLEDYLAAGTPTGGIWNIPNLGTVYTASPGLTAVNINPALTTLGTHTVFYTYVPTGLACSVTNQFTINVVAGFNLNTNGQSTYCSNIGLGAIISATASPAAGITFTWMPGNLPGPSQTVTPSSQTIYTVLSSNGACNLSGTTLVNVSMSCCNSTSLITSNVIGIPNTVTILSGGNAINQNVTVQGTVFVSGEFVMAPGVSITVPTGNAMYSARGTHIYACNDMWSGIQVNSGGQVRFTFDDLIEDAVEAISSNGNTSTNSGDIALYQVVFNRNKTALAIRNYNQNSTTPPFVMYGCVVTCRDFSIPPGSTTWPNSDNTSAPGLRAITGPTNSLASPYNLQNYPPVYLKSPYNNQPSYAGVYIENSGTTTSPTSTNPVFTTILIGDKSNIDNYFFNLFDNLMYGIYSLGSNVESQNNTFQNTRRSVTYTPRPHIDGGYGIYAVDNYSIASNNYLTITHPSGAANNGRINKFYDCNVGIGTSNIFAADLEYADIRGSQTPANPAPNILLATGNLGIYMKGNRFKAFTVDHNALKNLNIGIYFVNSYGNLNLPGQPNYGQYLGKVTINRNEITSATSTTSPVSGRISTAIYAAGILANSTPSFKEPNADLRIQYNNLDRVYAGVQLYGFNYSAYSAFAANNTIQLIQDVNANQQFGVGVYNAKANVINTNTITGFGITNTLVTGVYSALNGATSNSVNGVQCNSITNVFAGFEFAGSNVGALWRNNSMANIKRGLHLTNNGIIGQQGIATAPGDNKWIGSWAGNFNTFTDAYTFPTNSPLYVRNVSPYLPLNNANSSGFPTQTYGAAGTLFFANSSAPFVNCFPAGGGGGGCPTCKMALLDSIANNNITYTVTVPETKEINQNLVYNDVAGDPSLATASSTLSSFYTTNLSGTRGLYQNIDASFAQGNLNGVATLLAAFNPTTNIENNYNTYYSIAKSYFGNGSLTLAEELNLLILAHQCPFTDGAIVYDARSLYNLVTQTVIKYNDYNCSKRGFSFRENSDSSNENQNDLYSQLLNNETITKNKFNAMAVNYELYPNPAQNEVNISSVTGSETIFIRINDATGKLLMEKKLIISDYIAKLDLNLINGIYIVEIVNKDQKHEYKKLIISK